MFNKIGQKLEVFGIADSNFEIITSLLVQNNNILLIFDKNDYEVCLRKSKVSIGGERNTPEFWLSKSWSVILKTHFVEYCQSFKVYKNHLKPDIGQPVKLELEYLLLFSSYLPPLACLPLSQYLVTVNNFT